MPVQSHQKSGTQAYRRRDAKRLRRDRKIYGFLRRMVGLAEDWHRQAGEPIEPLSVYTGKPDKPKPRNPGPYQLPNITPFPVTKQEHNGRPLPQWEDLSQWMKVQVVPMAYMGDFQTFNINIHPDLESDWVSAGDDPRRKMRDRVRKELDRAFDTGREFFFVIEGWSKDTQAPTHLHIHGGAALREAGDDLKIEEAVGRAAGHGLSGSSNIPRAIHSKPFRVEQAAYATYLFKAAKRHDPRLPVRRLAMSNSLTGTARLFWETITRDFADWREPS
jgi:hypothetical protein